MHPDNEKLAKILNENLRGKITMYKTSANHVRGTFNRRTPENLAQLHAAFIEAFGHPSKRQKGRLVYETPAFIASLVPEVSPEHPAPDVRLKLKIDRKGILPALIEGDN